MRKENYLGDIFVYWVEATFPDDFSTWQFPTVTNPMQQISIELGWEILLHEIYCPEMLSSNKCFALCNTLE